NGNAEPWGRLFWFYNPSAPSADWRTLPQFASPAPPAGSASLAAQDNPGQGFSFLREGTGANDAFACLLGYNDPGVDHDLPEVSDFQLYRKGEWTLTHPISYQGNALEDNTSLVAGLGKMGEASGRLGYDLGTNGSYAYVAASTGGDWAYEGYWNPPPSFLQEQTRSMFYLPGGAN